MSQDDQDFLAAEVKEKFPNIQYVEFFFFFPLLLLLILSFHSTLMAIFSSRAQFDYGEGKQPAWADQDGVMHEPEEKDKLPPLAPVISAPDPLKDALEYERTGKRKTPETINLTAPTTDNKKPSTTAKEEKPRDPNEPIIERSYSGGSGPRLDPPKSAEELFKENMNAQVQ